MSAKFTIETDYDWLLHSAWLVADPALLRHRPAAVESLGGYMTRLVNGEAT